MSPLPSFIRKTPRGVVLDVAKMPVDDSFMVFVDRLFAQGAYFTQLDHASFQALLYQPESIRSPAREIRLAAGIMRLSPERRSLYKEVRVLDQGARAEYLFEPVFLEVAEPEPQPGQTPALDHRDRSRLEPARLDIDEFICVMWTKGVRFGIQVQAVQDAIAANKADRVAVALELAPQPGRDAELLEQFEGLHRDDSPLITSGRADLRRFKNRFPQIAKGTRMMKKVPRQLGKPGFRVTGELIEPDLPKDLSLEALAGPGTRIDNGPDGEFITAAASGFISIDVGSNLISVTEKIENKSGINAKTTGDLTLSVDEFVEHGEVQEGRVVEGKHMKFTSTVYGSLVSKAGRIELADSLSGGRATSTGGSIHIKHRALNAGVEAVGGSIDVHYAENSTLIGDEVVIGHAINCEVIANSLRVGVAQGCTLVAQSVQIQTSDVRRGKPTLVTVLVPDAAEGRRKLAALWAGVADIEQKIEAVSAEVKKLAADPEFSKLLALTEMVRAGKLALSPVQESSFRQMQQRHLTGLKAMERFAKEKQALQQSLQAKHDEIAHFKQTQQAVAARRECTIQEVIGETCVQTVGTALGVPHFRGVSGNEFGMKLRDMSPSPKRIFLKECGTLAWRHAADDGLAAAP
ncbi:flagellar assembly protein A [Rubrivivax rivuli]|uniref:flagellar assembly protein A n=1 Tax=Rubrivivax rivuli TaxID=1862385 RepID=UPI0013E2B362|nr:flagellar assembly protein A [Rubrivivax rivuli]